MEGQQFIDVFLVKQNPHTEAASSSNMPIQQANHNQMGDMYLGYSEDEGMKK